ncbi:hypothetical protein BDV95DRAFT_519257 [Massariosphaeria phaeospora]|uniref:Shugoshin n=1 Tax=Massariosphaeria phaeospora TaxID=100035 RepID=A0A7C8M9V4_9PLEO|nr:hypothetical protein BDV95DRAFT_519257 [Massariosphaeria phaeospora]
MARLNEPPVAPIVPAPSAETIDAVKRRFLRQNRELAKTNSQQSIRIRNLENDASRLLSENLSLREQVLQLQNTLSTQTNVPSFEVIDSVKEKLEAKIHELGGLVAELGLLHRSDTLPRCKSQTAATRRSPSERQWRSGLGLQEVENAMMPTIVEDKYYPRRTMNTDDLQDILDDPDTQSPDIGPPPVSRFENEEAIVFSHSPSREEQLGGPEETSEPALSINFETRKKRRESGPKLNIRRVSVFQSPPEDSGDVPAKSKRAGAKRKFNVQEDEDQVAAKAEGFTYSRRNTPSAPSDADVDRDCQNQSPQRPVLGSKPVNTDPVLSPKKQRPSNQEKPDKKPVSTSKPTRSRLTITRNVVRAVPPPSEVLEPIPVTEVVLESLPPKTPAVEDVFSPPSTEPSTARPESKDTPPPGDLNSSDQIGIGGRPSRRVRGQVSYKEPSLNTKMRRPGKELVDAVQSHQERDTSAEFQAASLTSGNIGIKVEAREESAWKPMARSGGEEEGEMGSPLRQKLDRKEGITDSNHIASPEPPQLSCTTSNAISALVNQTGTTRRKTSPTCSASANSPVEVPSSLASKLSNITAAMPLAVKEEDRNGLAIFDFTGSSPSDATASSRPQTDLAKKVRDARRHSVVPAACVTDGRKPDPIGKADGALPSLHKRTSNGTVSGMKSVSANHLDKSTTSSRASLKDKKIGALPTSGSNVNLRSAIEANGSKDIASLRAERAASRRKSMML